ncbi:ecto-ADP-ribosyltransferase 5-like [Clinocottus analis]|uniref:ecto-ADP-ribosyltransferase 5-like n=1 Tax=Clinocottus analis TaxID=304258 RepID=UPI0035C0101D
MAMKVLWAAALLAYGASTGAAMDPGHGASSSSSSPLQPLDMAPNSVDDMYVGCREKMEERVATYLENEKNANPDFKKAWNTALLYRTNNLMSAAIYVYAAQEPNIHDPLNLAVHDEGPKYRTEFKFHALHFYLTTAIQTLHKENQCFTVTRRTKKFFNAVTVKTQVRFGNFASSTTDSLAQTLNSGFGKETCFEIDTCMGADIKEHAVFKTENEVLIPPYEVFTVTEVKKVAQFPGLACNVVYKLQSTKKSVSKLNCALFPK